MVTWGLFEAGKGGRGFYLFNTHFPHRREDERARLECGKLLAERLRGVREEIPVILTGDFNAAPSSPAYDALSEGFKDSRLTAIRRLGPDGTSSGFSGSTQGRRIDWIFYRGELKAIESETVVNERNGRFPSDHFPVLAVFEIP